MSAQKEPKHMASPDLKDPSGHYSPEEKYKSSLTPPIVVYTTSLFFVGSALDRENNLLLVYGVDKHGSCWYRHFRGHMLIFTLEGYLVTRYLCKTVHYNQSPVSVHFTSDNILVMPSKCSPLFCFIFHFTDYSSEVPNVIEGKLFACHKDGEIYNTGSQQNSILLYSSDFKMKKNFKLISPDPLPGFIIALMIEGDVLIVLAKLCKELHWHPKFEWPIVTPGCELYRYCLKTGDLLSLCVLSDGLNYRKIKNVCCTDSFLHVLLVCDKSTGYCVWGIDGRISFYHLKEKRCPRKWDTKTIGLSLTDTFQLICVMYSGGFKIHNII